MQITSFVEKYGPPPCKPTEDMQTYKKWYYKAYYAEHKKDLDEYQKEYNKNNKNKYTSYQREYQTKKRKAEKELRKLTSPKLYFVMSDKETNKEILA